MRNKTFMESLTRTNTGSGQVDRVSPNFSNMDQKSSKALLTERKSPLFT